MAQTKDKASNLTKAQGTEYDALPTKSAKIRFLTSLEWSRGDIARHMNIRYQHVRNVQITPVATPKK